MIIMLSPKDLKASGRLKQVQDITTDDFLLGAPRTMWLLSSLTVFVYGANAKLLKYRHGENGTIVSLEELAEIMSRELST